MDYIDKTKPIRSGEEIDLAKVEAFLKDALPGLQGKLTVEQFPGGHSNLTYLIRVGDRELIFRRPPFGHKAKTAHDMGREYRIQKALKPFFPYCPMPLAYTDDESIIGCPFYVMERIRGIILRKELPPGMTLTPVDARTLCERFVDVYAELHSIDYRKAGMDGFGRPEGYVRRQVDGWSERYRNAKTPDAPDCEEIMSWLQAEMPADSPRASVIHNDYRFDNVVLSPENPLQIIGVLDWEMATIGDPLMDLGGALAYWINHDDPPDLKTLAFSPTHLKGMMSRRELVERYARITGVTISNMGYYYCFGLFRLAVIAQQIYYRFYHGQTKDERFKLMIIIVHIVDEAARRIIREAEL
ncbi:MAG: putative aminoglycoside phosphotransferase [Syntrophaceae bacterium PtaB.Bin095]|nr:MAG: putative aminoglycoside phosphotransferase [Syntrophaceae bacterium PtaB.Bin095]